MKASEVLCEARETTSCVLGSYTFFPSFIHLPQQIVIERTVYQAWCQHKFKDKSSVSRWDIPFIIFQLFTFYVYLRDGFTIKPALSFFLFLG